MNEAEFQKLIETSWRRALRPEEESRVEAWLAAHPGDAPRWRDEAGLNRLLQRLPEVPVSSNFTARVVAALDRDERVAARGRVSRPGWLAWWRRRWQPVGVAAAVVLLAAGFARMQYQQHARQVIARELAELPAVGLPSPEVFQDFDAIRELRTLPAVSDDDLIVALQ